MDLELLEALALSDDRAAALSQLVPGSEDHDYYRALALQHASALDEVDALLATWPGRHGRTQRLARLRRRQQLLRLGATPPAISDETVEDLRQAAGASLWHEAERAEKEQHHPTRLEPALLDRAALIADAVRQSPDLSQVHNDGLPDLIDQPLDAAQRRQLLSRLGRSRHPRVVELIAAELTDRGSRGFGALPVHQTLTLDQLHALAERVPGVRQLDVWVEEVLRRLHPPPHVDWRSDAAARAAYLDRLWAFVSTLAPSFNGLRAHVLYHRLDHDRRLGIRDRDRFLAYLALPRRVAYVRAAWLKGVAKNEVVQLGQPAPSGFDPVALDEPLVVDYLHHFLASEDGAAFADWLDASWLATELATVRLLTGAAEPERWAAMLGPARVAALRERVDLDLAIENPAHLAADAPVALDVWVKNVPALTVKVFRINTLAWFQGNGSDVDTAIDLDGLAAGHEETLRVPDPPVRRVRRRIELPACARPGTYVVELIGNGRSSRALLRKGALRHVSRIGAGGPVVTVLDERGAALPGATVWLGGREYRARDDGAIALPFSTRPGATPILLVHGDLAVRSLLDHRAETYRFAAHVHLEREALVAGQTARAVVRAALTVADTPAPLALVEDTRIAITLTDVAGTTTTREQPIELRDDRDAVVEWQTPDQAVHVALQVRGRVRVVSEQRTLDVEDGVAAAIAAIHHGDGTEAMHLARAAGGWVLSLLGKSGEPRPGRALVLALRHRAVTSDVHATIETDEDGRAELGALDDILWLAATAPSGLAQRWHLPEPTLALRSTLRVREGDDAVIAVGSQVAAPVLDETRGGLPLRDASDHLHVDGAALVASRLPAGSYELSAAGLGRAVFVTVVPRAAPVVAGWAIGAAEAVELSPPALAIRDIAADDGHVVIRVSGASPETRVHAVATRFLSAPVGERDLARPPRTPGHARFPGTESAYVSGRELGDEYRYVLERRGATRRAGTLLPRPGLLLNPWALRSTTSQIATAAAGTGYAAQALRAPAPTGGGRMMAREEREVPTDVPGLDFLPRAAIVLANLRPDPRGFVRIPIAELAGATSLRVIAVDALQTASARHALDETALAPRDLRLRLGLPPDGHFAQDKRVTGLAAGAVLRVDDLATARVQVVETVAQVHAFLLTLSDDVDLRTFGFAATWHTLSPSEKRTTYSEHACHELHLFLHGKDPAFFAEVVRPYLAHKRHRTFVDRWLLDEDLTGYLEPWAFGRLNAVERVLLARRMAAVRDAVARLIGDAVDLVPRDPAEDARRIDVLLAGGALDRDDRLGIAAAARDAFLLAEAAAPMPEPAPPPMRAKRARAEHDTSEMAKVAMIAPGGPPPMPAAAPMVGFAPPPPPQAGFGGGLDAATTAADLASREEIAPLFRAQGRTQEWAENDWWHRRVDETNAALIPPSRFWRDLALHATGPFLSPHVADCAGSFADAMCALAFLDLPFTAGAHRVDAADGAMTLTAATPCLVAHSQLARVDAPAARGAILVGQSYFRADDRWDWDGAVQREKYVAGELLAGVVYACRVVVTNPTAARQELDVLLQIPRGAIAVAGGVATRTQHAAVEPYGTWSVEHAFYFPTAGRFTHFPAHVTRAGELVAWAEPSTLDVVDTLSQLDTASWLHVAQHGSLDDVAAFLDRANLGRLDLERVAWRLRDRSAFDRITAALARRLAYSDALWAYALVHRDRGRLAEWLRHQDAVVRDAGPVLDGGIPLDPVARGWYQHLEYAPLVVARAHRLGARTRILDDGLDRQYRAFLDVVAHRPRPTDDDLLAAAHYLFTQGRDDDALAAFARVDDTAITTRLPYDYLAAYAATLVGDLPRARRHAAPWADHPVDRWRHRFAGLLAMLDEAEGAGPAAAVDADSRDQRQAELAAREPALELAVDGADLVVDSRNLAACQLRFYRLDLELLFSRQPFVQGDTRRFSYIEPSHTIDLPLADGRTRAALPASLRGANLVVEAVAPGVRRSIAHYAHDLALEVAHGYGQLRVTRASTGAPLPATYVKVYARHRGGAVHFYKDGYTDLRGRLDYATLSTDELDRVERFAILVVSDQAGATVTEAEPPPR